MNNNTGGSAFPNGLTRYSGMTLRDYFAGQMLASVFCSQGRNKPDVSEIAKAAYLVADAMLEARK